MTEKIKKIKNQKRSPINSLRKKKIDHKTDERNTYLTKTQDEDEYFWCLIQVSKASSLPGNGAKNLMDQILNSLKGCQKLDSSNFNP